MQVQSNQAVDKRRTSRPPVHIYPSTEHHETALGQNRSNPYQQVTMDIVLHYADQCFFTPYVYPAGWAPEDISRQYLSLCLLTTIGSYVLYLGLATLNYYFVFDHQLMQHPQFLKVIVHRYYHYFKIFLRIKIKFPFFYFFIFRIKYEWKSNTLRLAFPSWLC